MRRLPSLIALFAITLTAAPVLADEAGNRRPGNGAGAGKGVAGNAQGRFQGGMRNMMSLSLMQ